MKFSKYISLVLQWINLQILENQVLKEDEFSYITKRILHVKNFLKPIFVVLDLFNFLLVFFSAKAEENSSQKTRRHEVELASFA